MNKKNLVNLSILKSGAYNETKNLIKLADKEFDTCLHIDLECSTSYEDIIAWSSFTPERYTKTNESFETFESLAYNIKCFCEDKDKSLSTFILVTSMSLVYGIRNMEYEYLVKGLDNIREVCRDNNCIIWFISYITQRIEHQRILSEDITKQLPADSLSYDENSYLLKDKSEGLMHILREGMFDSIVRIDRDDDNRLSILTVENDVINSLTIPNRFRW